MRARPARPRRVPRARRSPSSGGCSSATRGTAWVAPGGLRGGRATTAALAATSRDPPGDPRDEIWNGSRLDERRREERRGAAPAPGVLLLAADRRRRRPPRPSTPRPSAGDRRRRDRRRRRRGPSTRRRRRPALRRRATGGPRDTDRSRAWHAPGSQNAFEDEHARAGKVPAMRRRRDARVAPPCAATGRSTRCSSACGARPLARPGGACALQVGVPVVAARAHARWAGTASRRRRASASTHAGDVLAQRGGAPLYLFDQPLELVCPPLRGATRAPKYFAEDYMQALGPAGCAPPQRKYARARARARAPPPLRPNSRERDARDLPLPERDVIAGLCLSLSLSGTRARARARAPRAAARRARPAAGRRRASAPPVGVRRRRGRRARACTPTRGARASGSRCSRALRSSALPTRGPRAAATCVRVPLPRAPRRAPARPLRGAASSSTRSRPTARATRARSPAATTASRGRASSARARLVFIPAEREHAVENLGRDARDLAQLRSSTRTPSRASRASPRRWSRRAAPRPRAPRSPSSARARAPSRRRARSATTTPGPRVRAVRGRAREGQLAALHARLAPLARDDGADDGEADLRWDQFLRNRPAHQPGYDDAAYRAALVRFLERPGVAAARDAARRADLRRPRRRRRAAREREAPARATTKPPRASSARACASPARARATRAARGAAGPRPSGEADCVACAARGGAVRPMRSQFGLDVVVLRPRRARARAPARRLCAPPLRARAPRFASERLGQRALAVPRPRRRGDPRRARGPGGVGGVRRRARRGALVGTAAARRATVAAARRARVGRAGGRRRARGPRVLVQRAARGRDEAVAPGQGRGAPAARGRARVPDARRRLLRPRARAAERRRCSRSRPSASGSARSADAAASPAFEDAAAALADAERIAPQYNRLVVFDTRRVHRVSRAPRARARRPFQTSPGYSRPLSAEPESRRSRAVSSARGSKKNKTQKGAHRASRAWQACARFAGRFGDRMLLFAIENAGDGVNLINGIARLRGRVALAGSRAPRASYIAGLRNLPPERNFIRKRNHVLSCDDGSSWCARVHLFKRMHTHRPLLTKNAFLFCRRALQISRNRFL